MEGFVAQVREHRTYVLADVGLGCRDEVVDIAKCSTVFRPIPFEAADELVQAPAGLVSFPARLEQDYEMSSRVDGLELDTGARQRVSDQDIVHIVNTVE